ncbi:hypothetical protein ACJRO7_026035 [Eucalyptus globulus]|uniref:Uncharacterized protein n=1 Tax=Eucalyptus globulus TaxID=34317 RepID=A0ABD3KFV5_EUCGL
MGYVVMISLPAILLCLMIMALICYLIGRAWGRRRAQYYQPPEPTLRSHPRPPEVT